MRSIRFLMQQKTPVSQKLLMMPYCQNWFGRYGKTSESRGLPMNRSSLRASGAPAQVGPGNRDTKAELVQEHRAVEGVALDGFEAGVTDDSAQLFLGGAVTRAGGSDYIFFQHYGAYVVATEV